MKCYKYNYNDHKCEGSFDDCKELIDCPYVEGARHPVCFTVSIYDKKAQVPSNITSSSRSSKIERPLQITSAGCFEDESLKNCGTDQCRGYLQGKVNHYYCCCTGNGCNRELIPPEQPPPDSSTAPSTPSPMLSAPQESIPSTFNPSVMLLAVIVTIISAVLFVTYYRRFRPKRHTSNNNRAGNHYQFSDRSTSANNNNNNNAGTDVSILMPFRNSFNDDGSNNYQYGPRPPGQRPDGPNGTRMGPSNSTSNQVNGLLPGHRGQNQKFDLKDIKLLEMAGSGRFGTVHRANLVKRMQKNDNASNPTGSQTDELKQRQDNGDKGAGEEGEEEQLINSEIAVKIIPNNEYQSWQNELRIYNSSRIRHPNILTFLGSCESPQTNANWLLVEYASNGSLHHYLKENTVSWDEFLSISLGIVRGLSHLHDADIAHRDFKSKNVLLRHNLSPCITDFGVAVMMDISGGSHNEQRKKYLQVGTPRYMAPEVLECSVSFTKISFTKIDVYALSLVLWELLSRCHPLPKLVVTDQINVEPFMLPPPLESSQPATSTPNKRTAQAAAGASTEPSTTEPNLTIQHGHTDYNNAQYGGIGCGDGLDLVDGVPVATAAAARHHLQRFLDERRDEVPSYKVPFEDVVGPNPDINAMRQVVVSDKIRPPIRPEWRFYPIAKLCQAITDGWEYDHDARISASCFVERIETMMHQKQHELTETGPPRSGGNRSAAPGSHTTAQELTNVATTMTAPMIATTVT